MEEKEQEETGRAGLMIWKIRGADKWQRSTLVVIDCITEAGGKVS